MQTVAIRRCTAYEQQGLNTAIDGCLATLGGLERFVSPGQTVLLKVNMVGPHAPERAATTHPEFVRAVVRAVKAVGGVPWVGDSAGGAIAGLAPTGRSFEVSGYAAVCREEGARIVNFDAEPAVAVPAGPGLPYREHFLARAVCEADVIINLPKFKTHASQMYTGAVKNLFGCLPGLLKAAYHRTSPGPVEFGALVADVHRACAVDLHLMDAVVGHHGFGPTAGSPKPVGAILAAVDPVALDAIACRMMGLAPRRVEMLVQAELAGLGTLDEFRIDLVGDFSRPPVVRGWQLPSRAVQSRTPQLLSATIGFLQTRPVIDLRRCRNCGMCIDSCPVKAIDRPTKRIDYQRCFGCLCCHELCEHKAVPLRRTSPLAAFLMRRFDKHQKP